jgi:hypothetical protein
MGERCAVCNIVFLPWEKKRLIQSMAFSCPRRKCMLSAEESVVVGGRLLRRLKELVVFAFVIRRTCHDNPFELIQFNSPLHAHILPPAASSESQRCRFFSVQMFWVSIVVPRLQKPGFWLLQTSLHFTQRVRHQELSPQGHSLPLITQHNIFFTHFPVLTPHLPVGRMRYFVFRVCAEGSVSPS